jgi:hypothetical protein
VGQRGYKEHILSFSSDQAQVTNQVETTVDFDGNEKVFKETLTNAYRKVATSVNSKTGGLYQPIEISNSEQFFTPDNPQKLRNVYRITIDFGALPNATTKSVPHGVNFTSEFTATRIYGASTDADSLLYIPLPYATASGDDIELLITASEVTIITNSDRSNFIITYVVIEYCKTQ